MVVINSRPIDCIIKKICKSYGLIDSGFYGAEDRQCNEDETYEEDDNDSLPDKLFYNDYPANDGSAAKPSDFLNERHFLLSDYCRIIYSPPDLA